MEEIYKNELCTIEFDKKEGVLLGTYKGLVNDRYDQVLSIMDAIIDFTSNNKVKLMITDLRKSRGNFFYSFGYIDDKFFPAMEKAGVTRSIVLVPEDILVEHLVSKINDRNITFHRQIFKEKDLPSADEKIKEILSRYIKNISIRPGK